MTTPTDRDHQQEATVPAKTGRTRYSRTDLRRVHGLSESTLQNLWVNRESNGHPAAEIIDGVMHWDGVEWATWHHELQRSRAAANTTNAPKLDGDPEELVSPAEAAKICGFADSTTVSHYVKNPPEGWPDPDDWDELPTRRRPKWKRWRLWQYLADRKGRGHAGGRPTGTGSRVAYPYQGDERLTLARQALAANPKATNAELIPLLQEQGAKPYSRPTWNNILKSARNNPEED